MQVSLENGIVLNFDARTLPSTTDSASPARFTLSAHDGAASALDVNPHIRGCIATGGTDKIVKVWNINEDSDSNKRDVSLVTSRDLGVVSRWFFSFSPFLAVSHIHTCLGFGMLIDGDVRARSSRLRGHQMILWH